MKATSLMTWVDLEDGHEYHPGESFPHDGREISEDRIDALTTALNSLGKPVVEVVEEPKEKPTKKKTK